MSTETFPAAAPPASVDVLGAPRRPSPARILAPEKLRLASWGVAAILAALLLISLWLRTRALGMYYWVDEGLSVGIAGHPLAHIPSLLQQDGSPPLYYLILHLWMDLRGRGEVATHELSLIFALLTVPVAYWGGASLFDRRTGVICALLAAGAPYLTVYAHETRMYALLALLALIAGASFVHAFVFRRRRYLPVFVVSLTASMYTHNWALFLVGAAGVSFAVCAWETPPDARRPLFRDGALALAGVAILYAPWIPTLLYQARHTGAPWDLPPVLWSYTQGLYSLVGGRGAAVALLLAGGSGLWALRETVLLRESMFAAVPEPDRPRTLLLAAKTLLILGFGTLAIGWLYSKYTPAWASRYLAVVVGPLILLFGMGLARARRLGIVALVLICCFWVLDPVPSARSAKSNVGAAVGQFRRDIHPGDLVLSTQPEQVPTIAYYLPTSTQFGTPMGGRVPDPRIVDWRNALSRLRHSSVGATLMPMIDSLSPGQHVLLVAPQKLPKTPLWLKLIDRDSTRWETALDRDPTLRLVAQTHTGSGGSGLGVHAVLFVVH